MNNPSSSACPWLDNASSAQVMWTSDVFSKMNVHELSGLLQKENDWAYEGSSLKNVSRKDPVWNAVRQEASRVWAHLFLKFNLNEVPSNSIYAAMPGGLLVAPSQEVIIKDRHNDQATWFSGSIQELLVQSWCHSAPTPGVRFGLDEQTAQQMFLCSNATRVRLPANTSHIQCLLKMLNEIGRHDQHLEQVWSGKIPAPDVPPHHRTLHSMPALSIDHVMPLFMSKMDLAKVALNDPTWIKWWSSPKGASLHGAAHVISCILDGDGSPNEKKELLTKLRPYMDHTILFDAWKNADHGKVLRRGLIGSWFATAQGCGIPAPQAIAAHASTLATFLSDYADDPSMWGKYVDQFKPNPICAQAMNLAGARLWLSHNFYKTPRQKKPPEVSWDVLRRAQLVPHNLSWDVLDGEMSARFEKQSRTQLTPLDEAQALAHAQSIVQSFELRNHLAAEVHSAMDPPVKKRRM